eukprot:378143-Prorocentrum_minimum.AAC.1
MFPSFVASSGPSSCFLLAWPLPPPIPGLAEGGTLEMACAHTYMGLINSNSTDANGTWTDAWTEQTRLGGTRETDAWNVAVARVIPGIVRLISARATTRPLGHRNLGDSASVLTCASGVNTGQMVSLCFRRSQVPV